MAHYRIVSLLLILVVVSVHGKAVLKPSGEHRKVIDLAESEEDAALYNAHPVNEDTLDIQEDYNEEILEGNNEEEEEDLLEEENHADSVHDISHKGVVVDEVGDEEDIDDAVIIEMLEEVKDLQNEKENKDMHGNDLIYKVSEFEGEVIQKTLFTDSDEEDDDDGDDHFGDDDEFKDHFSSKFEDDDDDSDYDDDDDDDDDDDNGFFHHGKHNDDEEDDDEEEEEDEEDNEDRLPFQVEFRPVSEPTDFDSYDILDHNGFITLEELINVTGAMDHIQEAFHDTDVNDDGVVSRDEFEKAPWSLAGDPEENAAPKELIEVMEEDIEQMEEAKEDLGQKSKKADKVLDTLIVKEEQEEDKVIQGANEEELKGVQLRRRKSHWDALGM